MKSFTAWIGPSLVFHATVDEIAEDATVLESRDVYFVVPPAP